MPAIKLRDDGRIQRLVSIAYILSTRSEVHIDELCERLEVSKEQLESDLNVLMFCGLPPYSPEQLFDITIEDEFVSMYFNDVFVSPLRLKNSEIVQVMVALERLKSESSSDQEIKKIIQTISKINKSQDSPIEIDLIQSPHSETIQEALKSKCKLTIKYLSLNSTKIDDRIVIPKSIYNSASTSYLFAIEEKSAGERLFRVDRILEATVMTNDPIGSQESAEKSLSDLDSTNQQMFIDKTDGYVDLKVQDQAGWVLDSIPSEVVDKSTGIYRFSTSSPYFVARLLLSNFPYLEYQKGTISKEDVIAAVEDIKVQMQATKLV